MYFLLGMYSSVLDSFVTVLSETVCWFYYARPSEAIAVTVLDAKIFFSRFLKSFFFFKKKFEIEQFNLTLKHVAITHT